MVATLPFVNGVWGLVVASLAMEVMTLLWSPAKEAPVPNVVPASQLTTGNSLTEGWRFIAANPVVRAVMVGLATGLFGGGMVVPLGVTFSEEVLGAGNAGFSLLLTALGLGAALGVVSVSALQRRMTRERAFAWALIGGAVSMISVASTSSLTPAFTCVLAFGACAGAVYVLGFPILHENVGDELRGRIFATLYTLVRLCLVASLALAPFIAGFLNSVSSGLFGADKAVRLGGHSIALPGVRLTLWLGGLIILGAFVLATRALRGHDRSSSFRP